MKIFAIKNEKIGFFNRPIYVESSNEALSYIQNILMSDADRVLYGLKSDLALYEQGEIDFATGIIKGSKKPVFVCSLEDIFASVPEDVIPRNEKFLMNQIKILGEKISNLESVKGSDN